MPECGPRLDLARAGADRHQHKHDDPGRDMGGVESRDEVVEGEERMCLHADPLGRLAGILRPFDRNKDDAQPGRRRQERAGPRHAPRRHRLRAKRREPARGDEHEGVHPGRGTMEVVLRGGETGRIGEPHAEKGRKPGAEDQKFRHDQHPDHEIAGKVVEGAAPGVGRLRHAPTSCR